jgi:hypothetical protein
MDDAFAGWYTDSDIHAINRCRLYRQVECLSDICAADGLRIDPGLQAQPTPVTSQSIIKRPCQGLPCRCSWAVWRRFLSPYTRALSTTRLLQILGPWSMDAPRPLDLACILLIITNALSDGISAGNCTAWYNYLPAVPSSRDHEHAPIPSRFDPQ